MKQLFLIAALTLAAAGDARAESAELSATAKVPLARRLYEEGMDAAAKGRWSIAFDRFKAAHELAPRAQTLHNLAGAQSQTGRLVEAAENYRRFLRDTADGRFAELRVIATEQLELLDKQLAQVTFDVPNIEPGDLLAIDDVEFPHVALRQAMPMNPGPHVVRVQRGTQILTTRSLAFSAGATESVRIELPVKRLDLELRPPPSSTTVTGTASQPTPAHRGRGYAWLRSPWLWSGVALVVAGGATSAYLLTRPDGVVVH
jgi:hypothetical protein